jgi:hypothetical protein
MANRENGTPTGAISKIEAVTRTLQEFGPKIMPLAIKDHVKKRYSIEISASVASNYKKKLVKKAKLAGQPLAATAAGAVPSARKGRPPAKKAANGIRPGDTILLEDVLTTKTLLDRVGADRLRALINGLAK